MVSTFTPSKNLEEPANNDDVDTWDVPVNANWTAIDTAFGGKTTLNAVGASGTITLTPTQYTPPNIVITGAITANIVYALPTGVGGIWSIFNNTSGAHTITFQAFGGGNYVLPQGYRVMVVSDGTNVNLVSNTPPNAAGANGEIQFNSGGVLAGYTGFVFDGSSTLYLTAAAGPQLVINGNSGTSRVVFFQSNALNSWAIYVNNASQTGSNVGSDLVVQAYDDAGNYLSTLIYGRRSNGLVTIPNGVILPGNINSFAENVTNITEPFTATGSGASGTIGYYISSQSVLFFNMAATANFIISVAMSASSSLNSVMSVGQSVTVAFLTTQGATAYYCTTLLIDGSAVSVNWQGGVAPTAGHPNGIDVYTFTILKTASAAYTVLGSLVQF